MREIKFRVWDNEQKKMFYSKTEQFDDSLNFRFGHFDTEEPVYMQFTGLSDINDREIYEGDVLKNDYGDLWVVVWKGTGFMLALNGESKNIYSANEYYFSSCEVIGNIYENPELLKS